MQKTKRIELRLSEADYEKIQQIANESNRTVSELLRDHIGKVTVKDSALDRQKNVNLNRINSNLNMIAKWVNTHKELETGKSFNIKPPGKETQAVYDDFRSEINARYGLSDPDDPARKRDIALPSGEMKAKLTELLRLF